MNGLKKKIIAYRLDYHWHMLKKYKKQMFQLYDHRVSLSDERMLFLNEKFNHHCAMATRLDELLLWQFVK